MLSVIVPTYNERDNIRPLLERVLAVFDKLPGGAELLIVDDDSPDRTADEARGVARSLGAEDRVRVIVRKGERGLAPAVMEGFREAAGDILAVMDADLSHPPELLPELLGPILSGRAEVAVASRRVKGGGVSNWPLRRRLSSWFAGLLARPLVQIRDTTSGYFALRRSVIEGAKLKPRGYKIGLEILVRGRYDRAEEVPFVFTDRAAGRSKLGGGVVLDGLAQLGSLYRERFPMLVRFIQFSLVGGLGVVVDAAAFNLAYLGLGFSRLGPQAGSFLAQTASFLAAVVFNFVLNRAWTFKERKRRASLGVFVLVCAGGFVLRSLVVLGVVTAIRPEAGAGARWPLAENAALLAGISLASVWNFFASRRWAFPRGASDKSGEHRASGSKGS